MLYLSDKTRVVYAGTMNLTFSPDLVKTLIFISLTALITVIGNQILCSFIRVPKNFNTRRSRTYVAILRYIITVIVYGIALNVILVRLGINITPLLASAGIISIIIGLGMRSLIEDLISGISLLSQDAIAIGDTVKIDEAEGKIERIGFRTLILRADNGNVHIIPNGQVKKVTNLSRHAELVTIDLPVKADQSIKKVLQASKETLDALHKEKALENALLPGATINGISEFQPVGPMIVTVTIVVQHEKKDEAAFTYRFLAKKAFEKYRIQFG